MASYYPTEREEREWSDSDLTGRLLAAEQRVREMEPYLQHLPSCMADVFDDEPCTCGLAALHPVQKGSK